MGLFPDWFRALRPRRMPRLHLEVENGQGNWRQEDGGPPFLEVKRDGAGQFPTPAALVCDSFKNCEGLSRVAFMDGNGVVMLGKVISCERKEEGDKGGKKK